MEKDSIKLKKTALMLLSLPDESINRLKEIAKWYKQISEEENMNNNKNDVITKEQALAIAKEIVPDLENRRYYQISSEKPLRANIIGNIPEDCWYITYSQVTKDSDIFGLFSSSGIFINKFNGKIVYKGNLGDEG